MAIGSGTVLVPRSAEMFDAWGFNVTLVDIDEFEKMEGCVNCSRTSSTAGDASAF